MNANKDKIIGIITVITVGVIGGLTMGDTDELTMWILPGFLLCLAIFNFSVRRLRGYKSYFLSKFNILTHKYETKITSDLPIELMYGKMLELLEGTYIKVRSKDEKTFEIFGTTPVTWKSWGENVYIDFETHGDETTMYFRSVSIIGVTSWGKNETNFNRLMSNYENSLTI